MMTPNRRRRGVASPFSLKRRTFLQGVAAIGKKASPTKGPATGAIAGLTMHGRGAGDDGPIITNHARDPEQLATRLKENMVFIFKPHVQTPDRSHICTWGDTTSTVNVPT